MIVRKTFSRTTFNFNFTVGYILLLFGLMQCKSGRREIVPSITEQRNQQYPVLFKEEIVSYKQSVVLLKNKKVVVVDIRKPERYKQGHIPFALNISILDTTFYTQIGNLNKAHHYFIYGEGNEDVRQAMTKFRTSGFESLKGYEAGWQDWVNNGGNVVR